MRVSRRLLTSAVGALALFFTLVPAALAVDGGALRASLDRAVSATGAARTGAMAFDLTTGSTLYERNASTPRIPASVEKLFTTAAALRRFGTDARLTTTVVGDGEVGTKGGLSGDLYLVGGGDPTLDVDGIRRLAGQVRDAGVRRVSGSVLGDESHLDSLRGSSRTGGAYDSDMGGVLGALTVGRGFSNRPGGPALAAARRFVRALRAAGVKVEGRTGTGTAPSDGLPLAEIQSMTMANLVRAINIPSDNFAAEILLKDLGATYGSGGTTAAGAAVVRRTMAALGVDRRAVADGSGLSRANRVSAQGIVSLLAAMRRPGRSRALEAALAAAGRTGARRGRRRGTAAAGACRGKTGTINSVSALAGLCRTREGHTIAFAFLMNGVTVWRARAGQDAAASVLARYLTAPLGGRLPTP